MADAIPEMTQKFSHPSKDASISKRSAAIHALWRRAAGDRIAPKRAEIKLKAVRGLTQWFWLADVLDGGADFRFRIAGDRVEQFFGRSLRGMKLSELPDVAFGRKICSDFRRCLKSRSPVAVGPEISQFADKNYLELAAVILPLSEDGYKISGLMGILESWQIGTNPPLVRTGNTIIFSA